MAAQRGHWRWTKTRSRFAQLVVATIFINILAVALPLFSLQIYDRVLPNRANATLTLLVIGVAIAVALEIALRIERARLIAVNGAAFERDLSRAAVSWTLHAKIDDSGIHTASQKLQKLQAVRALRDFHSGYAVTVLIDFIFVFLYLGLIFYIGGAIVVAPIAVVALIIANGLVRSVRLRETIDARKEADTERYDFLVSTLNSLSALRCFALGGLFARRYEPLEYRTSLANFKASHASAQILNTSIVLGHVMTAAVITAGAAAAIIHNASIGTLIACVLLAGRLIPPLQRGVILWIKYQEYDLSRRQFLTLFNGEARPPPPVRPAGPAPRHVLELRDVGVAQRRGATPLLRGANAKFERGDMTIVRAQSPRQASLLLKMIAGLAAPNEGRILVDGVPVEALPLGERAHSVAYLSASTELFRGSILDNLTSFGQRSQEQALAAARMLGVDRDVARLPEGWNTHIAGKLSDETPLGLRQRIAFARALAARPPVILFDEAAELLDNRSYDLLVAALTSLRPASVILLNTYDENLIRFSNRELKFGDNGVMSFSLLKSFAAAPGRRGLSTA